MRKVQQTGASNPPPGFSRSGVRRWRELFKRAKRTNDVAQKAKAVEDLVSLVMVERGYADVEARHMVGITRMVDDREILTFSSAGYVLR